MASAPLFPGFPGSPEDEEPALSGDVSDDSAPPDPNEIKRIEIRRAGRKRPVLDASLVLASQGVRHWIEFDGESFLLTVEPPHAGRAFEVLDKYERENTGYSVDDPEVTPFDLYVTPVLHLAVPALFSFWAASVPWGKWMEQQGGASAVRILDGEWWRVLTATTLHADSEHFLGNMLSGYFIFNLLRRRCGPGTSMVLLTVAAALTNWTVAALSPSHFLSIGFSTVVFAGLGMLGGMETRFLPHGLRPGLRNITPLLGALFLAVMTGLGENADIKAHFIGFAYGAACAPLAFWLQRHGVDKVRWQVAGVLATWAVYAAAWWKVLG